MLVTLSGMIMDERFSHHSNALFPMLVTLEGIVTEVNSLRMEKA